MKKSILEIVVEPQDVLQEELINIRGGKVSPTNPGDCIDGCSSGRTDDPQTVFSVW